MSTGRRESSSAASGSGHAERARSSSYQSAHGSQRDLLENSAQGGGPPIARYAPDVNGQMARSDAWPALPVPPYAQGGFGALMPMHSGAFSGPQYGYSMSPYPPPHHAPHAQGLQMHLQGVSPHIPSLQMNQPSPQAFMQPSPSTSPMTQTPSHTLSGPRSRMMELQCLPQTPHGGAYLHQDDDFEGEGGAISMPDVLQEGWLEEQIQYSIAQAKKDLQADSDEEALDGYDSDGPGAKIRALRGELAEERARAKTLEAGVVKLVGVVAGLHKRQQVYEDRFRRLEVVKEQPAAKATIKANEHPAMKNVIHNLMRALMGRPTGNDALGELPGYPDGGTMPTLAAGGEMKIPQWNTSVTSVVNKKYISDVAAKALQNVKDNKNSDVPSESQTISIATEITKKYLQHLQVQYKTQSNPAQQQKKAGKDLEKKLHGRRRTLADTRRTGADCVAKLLKVPVPDLLAAIQTDLCSDRESTRGWTSADRKAAKERGWAGEAAHIRRPPQHRSGTGTYLYHLLQKCAEDDQARKKAGSASEDSEVEPDAPDETSKKRRAGQGTGSRKRPRTAMAMPLYNGPVGKYTSRVPATKTSSKSRPPPVLVRSSFFTRTSAPCTLNDYCGDDIPAISKGFVRREKKNFHGRSWKFVKYHPCSDSDDIADDEADTSDDQQKLVVQKRRDAQQDMSRGRGGEGGEARP